MSPSDRVSNLPFAKRICNAKLLPCCVVADDYSDDYDGHRGWSVQKMIDTRGYCLSRASELLPPPSAFESAQPPLMRHAACDEADLMEAGQLGMPGQSSMTSTSSGGAESWKTAISQRSLSSLPSQDLEGTLPAGPGGVGSHINLAASQLGADSCLLEPSSRGLPTRTSGLSKESGTLLSAGTVAAEATNGQGSWGSNDAAIAAGGSSKALPGSTRNAVAMKLNGNGGSVVANPAASASPLDKENTRSDDNRGPDGKRCPHMTACM